MSNDDEGDEDGDEQNPCAPASVFLSQLFADTCCGMLFVPTSNIHMLHVGGSARRCHTLSVRTKSQDEDAYFDRDSLRNVGIAENTSNV